MSNEFASRLRVVANVRIIYKQKPLKTVELFNVPLRLVTFTGAYQASKVPLEENSAQEAIYLKLPTATSFESMT